MGIDLTNEQIFCIYSLENWWKSRDKQVFEISGAAGTGKALANNTFIPTTKGPKHICDLTTDDLVYNRYGKPTKILGIYPQGKLKSYKISFDDGSSVECNDEHIWSYISESDPFGLELKSSTLKEIREGFLYGHKTYNIPIGNPIEGNEIYGRILPSGKFVINNEDKQESTNIIFGLAYTSIDQRWEFVREIMNEKALCGEDTVGYITVQFKNMRTLLSFKYLLSSLGIKSIPSQYSKLFKKGNSNYLQIVPNESNIDQFFSVKGKTKKNIEILNNLKNDSKFKSRTDYKYLKIIGIEPCGETEMTCIYVDDPEHLFLCSSFIPTHNTTIVKYFIERLGLNYDNTLFMCYMGKAATQLARHGIPAKTIHSSIYNYEEHVERDENGKVVFDDNGRIKLKKEFVLKPKLDKKIKLIVIDEGSMVNEKIAKDILSFNIPVVVLGDLNQLPPVFGNPFFLVNPDVILRQVMRQAEDSPIIYLAQKVLNNEVLKYGVYGTSFVIPKTDISDYHFKKADIVITGTNKLRYNINNYYREDLLRIKKLEYPHLNEKVICCKNNWDRIIDNNLYMTNGTTGFVDFIYRDSFNKRTMQMDFRPDYSKKSFKRVEFDYNHLYSKPGDEDSTYGYFYDKFEFAYAVTCHKVQGSQYPYVLYMHEDFMKNPDDRRRMLYTAITRASEVIGIII